MFGPLRPVPRLHGRLPRVEKALPARPGLRPLGAVQGAADFRRQRRRRQRGPRTDAAQGDEVLQPPRKRRRRAGLGRAAGVVDDRQRLLARAGARRQDPRHADRAARVQFDVQDDRRRARRRGGRGLPPPRDRPGHVRQLQKRLRQHPRADPVRNRSDGQELPQRNHAAQLHLPLARVRADGDRVLLPSQPVARVVSLLARPPLPVVRQSRSGGRAAAAPRSRQGGIEPLFLRHGRHRIRLPVPVARRVRRVGGRGPSRRFRPPQPRRGQARAAGRPTRRGSSTPTESRGIAAAAKTSATSTIRRRSDTSRT